MKLIDLTCSKCGASFKVDSDKSTVFCEHCGAKLLIDTETHHIKLDNAEDAGYQFEKGRQRAKSEKAVVDAETNKRNMKFAIIILGAMIVFFTIAVVLLFVFDDPESRSGSSVSSETDVSISQDDAEEFLSDSTEETEQITAQLPAVTDIADLQTVLNAFIAEFNTGRTDSVIYRVNSYDDISSVKLGDYSSRFKPEDYGEVTGARGLFRRNRIDLVAYEKNGSAGLLIYSLSNEYEIMDILKTSVRILDEDISENTFTEIESLIGERHEEVELSDKVSIVVYKDGADEGLVINCNNIESLDLSATYDYGIGIKNIYLNKGGYQQSGADYIGIIGYVVVSYDEEKQIRNNEDFLNEELWKIPIYEKGDGDEWIATGDHVPHKTEVVVKEDYTKHRSYGNYSGYLLVEDTTSGEQFVIDVNNYITRAYWERNPLQASADGYCVAEYHQRSEYLPLTRGNEEIELEEGTLVLLQNPSSGRTGDSVSTNPVEALVWREWERSGYDADVLYFNIDDLTIVY